MKQKYSKSQMFREMYDEGYTIAQIAKETNNYYSFVHRVIRRYEFEQQSQQGEQPNNQTNNQTDNQTDKTEIKELHDQGYSVDQILKELNLDEEQRSYVYSITRKLKKQEQKQKQKQEVTQ